MVGWLKENKLRWSGHIERMKSEGFVKSKCICVKSWVLIKLGRWRERANNAGANKSLTHISSTKR